MKFTAQEAAALERQYGPAIPRPVQVSGAAAMSVQSVHQCRKSNYSESLNSSSVQGPCQSLWIPGWFPTPMNKLTTSGGHWSTTGRRKKADRELIGFYCQVATTKANGPRNVSIMVVLPKGKRLPDEDSLEKSVWDSLVHCGRLVNDTPKWCRRGSISYARALLGAVPGTLILLEEV